MLGIRLSFVKEERNAQRGPRNCLFWGRVRGTVLMTWNKKKERVDPQGYYVLKAIYQTVDINNSYLFLCLGKLFFLMLWSPFLLSTYFMPEVPI